MRKIPFGVRKEPEQPYNAILVKAWRRSLRLKSGHGRRDDVWVFVEGNSIYVLSTNDRLGYCGLARYDKEDVVQGEPLVKAADVFLQYDWEVSEVLGTRGLDLSPYTIARRLRERL